MNFSEGQRGKAVKPHDTGGNQFRRPPLLWPRAHSCERKATRQTFAHSSDPAAPQAPAGSVWRLIPILAFAQGRFENVLTSRSLDTTRVWPGGVSYVSSFFPESQTFWMRKKFILNNRRREEQHRRRKIHLPPGLPGASAGPLRHGREIRPILQARQTQHLQPGSGCENTQVCKFPVRSQPAHRR